MSRKILVTLAGLLMAATRLLSNECCVESLSNLQLGASYSYLHLNVGEQPGFHGSLGGLEGCYEYGGCDGLYAGLKAAWRQGSTESAWGNRRLSYVDVQERLGYTYRSFCQNWRATLFSGFGYRYLHHHLSQDEQPSVKFEYNEFYIPVGLMFNYYLLCWCDVGLNVTWLPQVDPTVEIIPLKGARWILENSYKNFQVELPVTFYPWVNNCYTVVVKPFYEYWQDGRSTAKTLGGEPLGLPSNRYNFWGVEVNVGYAF